MYNTIFKEQFIKEYTTSDSVAQVCRQVFEKFEPYENEWRADLCTRSEEELQRVISTMTTFRNRSRYQRINIVRKYIQWCIDMNLAGQNREPPRFDSMIKGSMEIQSVANPLHFQYFLDSIFSPEDDLGVDNAYRCYYWLAYSGMKDVDIPKVTTDCVDLRYMVVRFDGEEYPVYREAVPAFYNCLHLNYFIFPNGAQRDRVGGTVLVRGIRGIPSVLSMRVELSKRTKESDSNLKLTYYRIWLSGLFYRAKYEREDLGETVDFQDESLEYIRDHYNNNSLKTKRNITNQTQRDYLIDYRSWKVAHFI